MGTVAVGAEAVSAEAQAAVGLEGEVEVLLAGDRTLRRLNREYRGKDKATDVLSFPAAEELAGRCMVGTWRFRWRRRSGRRRSMGIRCAMRCGCCCCMGCCILSGMDHEMDGGEMAEREGELRGRLRLPNGLIARVEGRGTAREKGRSRFPGGMTERKARAKATAKANTGVLRYAQDDGVKRSKGKAATSNVEQSTTGCAS